MRTSKTLGAIALAAAIAGAGAGGALARKDDAAEIDKTLVSDPRILAPVVECLDEGGRPYTAVPNPLLSEALAALTVC